jgi:HSP20 family protein
VRKEKEAFTIKADLPGIKEDDVDISITGNRLTVSGKREEETVDESDSYYCRERSHGSFSRSFTLPDTVNAEQIQADMQDGVRNLRVPKSPESQPKKIPLNLKTGNGGEKAKGKS